MFFGQQFSHALPFILFLFPAKKSVRNRDRLVRGKFIKTTMLWAFAMRIKRNELLASDSRRYRCTRLRRSCTPADYQMRIRPAIPRTNASRVQAQLSMYTRRRRPLYNAKPATCFFRQLGPGMRVIELRSRR